MIKDFDDKDFEPKEIALFEGQYMAAFKNLQAAIKAKKKLEKDEENLKKQIQAAMDEFGIKSIDNEFVRITRVAAGTDKTVVDLEAFAKAEPKNYGELLEDYPKTVKGKAGYVKFEAK